jgi:hypothetical protein
MLRAMRKAPSWLNRSAAQRVLLAAGGEILANLWQMTLRGGVEVALCLVELRGFEPLTPCMPYTA